MRRHNSDSIVPQMVKCRLCRDRSEHSNSFITAKMEFSETVCDRSEVNVFQSVFCLSCDRMPNVASRNNTSSNLKTPTYCSTSSGKFNVSSPSSHTKLSKILKNWPYLRLKEAANAAKDGELGAACRIEMERRKQNYKN
uniref:Uncharacterized protein n=1 Tax=Meloidogyne enterolobii TaxID=390850 RepID=A0A6V7TL14_MELEN|nr:unnamed protein product [Meloidogyne enterolobii]